MVKLFKLMIRFEENVCKSLEMIW